MVINKISETSFDAFIFDLDGTLVDTADDLGAALNKVLVNANQPTVPASVYRPVASNGAYGLLEAGFAKKWPDQNPLPLRQELLDHYLADIANYSACFKGIAQLLIALEQQGVKWGIMTNKPTFLTEPLVQALPELASAQAIVCGDTLELAKPHPEPLLHTAALLKVNPTRCLYIGDAKRDIDAAKAANMKSATALWGYIPSIDEAKGWQADFDWQTPIDGFSYI